MGGLRDVNEEPTAQIASDRTLRTLLTGSDGQYVSAPSYLDGVDRYATAQVPDNLTVGTSTDTADVFTADWTQLLISVRAELQITSPEPRSIGPPGLSPRSIGSGSPHFLAAALRLDARLTQSSGRCRESI